MEKVTLRLHRMPEETPPALTVHATLQAWGLPPPLPAAAGAQRLSREDTNVRQCCSRELAHGGERSLAWPQERARTAPHECWALLRF